MGRKSSLIQHVLVRERNKDLFRVVSLLRVTPLLRLLFQFQNFVMDRRPFCLPSPDMTALFSILSSLQL